MFKHGCLLLLMAALSQIASANQGKITSQEVTGPLAVLIQEALEGKAMKTFKTGYSFPNNKSTYGFDVGCFFFDGYQYKTDSSGFVFRDNSKPVKKPTFSCNGEVIATGTFAVVVKEEMIRLGLLQKSYGINVQEGTHSMIKNSVCNFIQGETVTSQESKLSCNYVCVELMRDYREAKKAGYGDTAVAVKLEERYNNGCWDI